MSPRLFWKTVVIWIAILFALAITTALIPGSKKWGPIIPFAVILPLALVNLWYLERRKRADPDAFKLSPRARRTYLIANIAIFAFVAAMNFLNPHADGWKIGLTVLWGVLALISAYRLYNSPPAESS